MDDLDRLITEFLEASAIAVVGATDDRAKYGHKVYKCCLDHGLKTFPVNPNTQTVMGNRAYARISDLPEPVQSISIITPPRVTEQVVAEAARAGVKCIWMQPGAESRLAIETATKYGINTIHGGPCILVVLGYRGE